MKLNTAILFVISGVLFQLLIKNKTGNFYYLLWFFAALITFLSFAQDIFQINFGIDQLLIADAFQLAYDLHGEQKRKSGELYICHPIAVAGLLRDLGGGAAMIAAGKYYFQRPLFQYFKTASYNKIKPFIDFEKSSEGKKIIQSAGYYPVNK